MTSDISPTEGNLPAEPNNFIGRERDLADLTAMLGRVRQLSLCGPGGIGKTRLALRLAATLAPDYPDGAWLVDLADISPGEAGAGAGDSGSAGRLVPRLTAALGIRQEPDRPLAETLAEALSGRKMLLVLDTCERHVHECADLITGLLAVCPGLRVIATSREPLGVRGEVVWRVPPLGVPPADYADRAGQANEVDGA